MTDIDILNYFSKWKSIPWIRINTDIEQYLKTRYLDSLSIKESYFRIKYNIHKRPTCPVCGKSVKFIGKESIGIFSKHCSTKCSSLDINVQKKLRATKLKKYGLTTYNNSNKIKQTCLSKYNVTNVFNIDKIREKNRISLYSIETINKRKETCLKKYGYTNNLSYLYSYNLIDVKKLKEKEIETKKKNNSLNTSKLEDQSYLLLKEKYSDVQKQYKSELYPFYCDFYIPSINLYIECNYHWTHGFHPYDPNNIEDQNKLELWKSKQTKYYDNAIKTWTIRDINKRNIAKQNKLNYIEFWNINELKQYINLIYY